jgi:5-methylcytosine-specific restriction protein A
MTQSHKLPTKPEQSFIVPTKQKVPRVDWTEQELILALELYFDNPKSRTSTAIIKKSDLPNDLKKLRKALGGNDSNTFRNANGIYQKMQNFVNLDPDCKAMGQHGRPNGGRLTKVIWIDYHDNLAGLKMAAQAIREDVKKQALDLLDESEDDIEEDAEGKLLMRMHKQRERSKKLVDAKKRQAFRRHGALICEICGFEFAKYYGTRGEGFIECHHTKPVNEYGYGRRTTIQELALLCANCHRMIHCKKPWLTIDQLRQVYVK